MIAGVGIDLVEVDRIRHLYARYGTRFLSRVFLPEELARPLAHQDPSPSLAARFAAKEAFVKAFPLPARISEVGLVIQEGKPRLVFRGTLAKTWSESGLKARVSISHERAMAIAVVVLFRQDLLWDSPPE